MESDYHMDLLYMLDNQLLCDVTFIAGVSKREVKAHKVILASKSVVFHAMFCGPCAHVDGAIDLPDIEPEILSELLRYIYASECNITEGTVADLIYSAKKYAIDELGAKCVHFLETSLDAENVLAILSIAFIFDEKNLFEKCFSFLYNNRRDVLLIPVDCWKSSIIQHVTQFLFNTSIMNPEKDLELCINALIRIQNDIKTLTDITKEDTHKRLLKNLLYLVRLPFMSFPVFLKIVSKSGRLNGPEKERIITELSLNEQTRNRLLRQSIKERPTKLIQRVEDIPFDTHSPFYFNNIRQQECLTISCSQSVYLTGLCLFKPVTNGICDVYVEIRNQRKLSLTNMAAQLCYHKHEVSEVLILPGAVLLQENTSYYVTVICIGVETFKGTPIPEVCVADLLFSFKDNRCSVENTVVPHSQIRCILVQTV